MATKVDFFDTPDGLAIENLLKDMDSSVSYITKDSYIPASDINTNASISFIEKHKSYIRKHPSMNVDQYIANLKIMSKVR